MKLKDILVVAVVSALVAVITVQAWGWLVSNQSDSQELGGGTRLIHGLSTDSTAPNAGEVRTTTLTTTGTTTLAESVDGLVVGGTISTAATGTVRTVYTNTTGPKLCDSSTGYLLVQSNGSFAPLTTWSLGTTTAAGIASTNLIASSTVATSTAGTQTFTFLDVATRLFRLDSGQVLTAIFSGDLSASSTNLSNLSAEAGIWCQDLNI